MLAAALLCFGVGFGPGRPVLAAAVGSAGSSASASAGLPPPVDTVSTPAALALAEYLTSIGAKVYAAYWCPHCHSQKELFGREAAARLTVIECAADGRNNRRELCEAKQIQGYPSWEINGRIEPGVHTLEKLADWSGYKGSRAF